MPISDVVQRLLRRTSAAEHAAARAWLVGTGLRAAFAVWVFGWWTPFRPWWPIESWWTWGLDGQLPGGSVPLDAVAVLGFCGQALQRTRWRRPAPEPADPPQCLD